MQPVKLTPISANRTHQHDSQHLFSIPRSIPNLPCLCKAEVQESWSILINRLESGSTSKFPVKRKSPCDYRRDQRRRNPLGKGWLLLVTMEQVLLTLGSLQEHRMEDFPQLHLLHVVQRRGTLVMTFILYHKYTSAGRSLKFYLGKRTRYPSINPPVEDFAHLVQCKCQPLWPRSSSFTPTHDPYTTCD